MRRLFLCVAIVALATSVFGGFKAKPVKTKRPEQYQVHAAVSGVTVAADLLLSDKEQKDFFYKPLNPSGVVPLRLAVFNDTKNEIFIPLEGIQLVGPDGKEIPKVEAQAVAEAVMKGLPIGSTADEPPVQVAAGPRVVSSGSDPTDPDHDPGLDPGDPRYDPSDPRSGRYGDRRIVPGVDVVLNPSSGDDYNEISARLIEKDFSDKAYLADPILPSMKRDRFLYFSMPDHSAGVKGFELRLLKGRGFTEGLSLKF